MLVTELRSLPISDTVHGNQVRAYAGISLCIDESRVQLMGINHFGFEVRQHT